MTTSIPHAVPAMARSLLPALLITAAGSLAAQVPDPEPGPFARIVTIAPKPGEGEAFENGYARHIEWHRAHGDRWTWYGWSFVLGPRMGRFMDGTFGHASADFDHPVDPAGDGADNARNVTPYADFVSHGVYRRLEDASRGTPLPDTSAYLVLVTYAVAPGRAAEFESAIADGARSARARSRPGREARRSWYRLELGGNGPEYLLMGGAPSWEAAIGIAADADRAVPSTAVRSVTTELLRYRPAHSYHP